MKKNSDIASTIVMCVMAVLIILCIVACALCMITNSVPKLNPVVAEEVEHNINDSEESIDEVTQSYEGATFIKGGTTQPNGAADEAEASGEYICSYSSDRVLSRSDVQTVISNCREVLPAGKSVPQMMINEVYAKHGYKFQTASIQSYFDGKSWYQSISTRNGDMNSVYGQLSSVEKANVEMLKVY